MRAAVRRFSPAVFVFVGALALWEVAVIVFGIREFMLPRPSVILRTFIEELPEVLAAGRTTLIEAAGGFVIGVVLGIGVAGATARWRLLREGAMPLAIAVNSTPIIALAPVMNQWFGTFRPVSKMAVVAVLVFFPVMINTVRGLTEVDRGELELMKSYAASDFEILRRVRLPHALPFTFSAMRVGASLAVIGAIVAEYFGGPNETLGVYITQKAALFKFAEAWAAIIVGTLMGVGFYLIVVGIEKLAMPWRTVKQSMATST